MATDSPFLPKKKKVFVIHHKKVFINIDKISGGGRIGGKSSIAVEENGSLAVTCRLGLQFSSLMLTAEHSIQGCEQADLHRKELRT